jgi:hypothetical protein
MTPATFTRTLLAFCVGYICGEVAGASNNVCLALGAALVLPVLLRAALERKWAREAWLNREECYERQERELVP